MPRKLFTRRLIVCGISAAALIVGFAPLAKAADNLDRQLGISLPTPRTKPPSLHPAPTPTQAETIRPVRGDLKNLQSSNNNQFNPKP